MERERAGASSTCGCILCTFSFLSLSPSSTPGRSVDRSVCRRALSKEDCRLHHIIFSYGLTVCSLRVLLCFWPPYRWCMVEQVEQLQNTDEPYVQFFWSVTRERYGRGKEKTPLKRGLWRKRWG